VRKLPNPGSRFPKLSMKAMTGEGALLLESRRDEGGRFPVEAEKRVDGAGARSGVMTRR